MKDTLIIIILELETYVLDERSKIEELSTYSTEQLLKIAIGYLNDFNYSLNYINKQKQTT